MEFNRCDDLEVVREILTAPDVFEHMGDDFTDCRETFQPNAHTGIWYVTVSSWGRIVGLFCLVPENQVCWKLHACMLPDTTTREKWEAARGLVPWLAERTWCQRLIAEVPRYNSPAVIYGVHGIGMRYVGTHEKAFMKFGRLHDLIILGRPVDGGGLCPVS